MNMLYKRLEIFQAYADRPVFPEKQKERFTTLNDLLNFLQFLNSHNFIQIIYYS